MVSEDSTYYPEIAAIVDYKILKEGLSLVQLSTLGTAFYVFKISCKSEIASDIKLS